MSQHSATFTVDPNEDEEEGLTDVVGVTEEEAQCIPSAIDPSHSLELPPSDTTFSVPSHVVPSPLDSTFDVAPGVEVPTCDVTARAAPGVEASAPEVTSRAAPGVEAPAGHCDVVSPLPPPPDLLPSVRHREELHSLDVTFAAGAADEIPPTSPGGSSLSASLKFLEASHLLSDEEMIRMGCQPPTRESGDVDVNASSSSLLTQSLVNASLTGPAGTLRLARSPLPSDAPVPTDDVSGVHASSARPLSAYSDVTSSGDTGYHGGEPESETTTSPVGSVDSGLPRSKNKVNLDGSGETNVCSDSADNATQHANDMDTVEEVTERSLSEADLTMQDEDADTGSEANAASVSSLAGGKKKRTRSPTPSSAKTESVPAKRSLTNSRHPPAPGRLANPARKSTASLSASSRGSATSPASGDRSTAARTNGTLRKSSTTAASSGSLARQGPTAPAARRMSGSAPKPTSSAGAGAPKGAASARPRRSISGSVGNVGGTEQRRSAPRESVDGGRRGPASGSGSLSARSATGEGRKGSVGSAATASGQGHGAGASSAAGAPASSRLKAPMTLNRTFAKKTTGASNSNAQTPRGSVSGPVRASHSATTSAPAPATGGSMGPTTPRRRDSQLQRQPAGPKSSRTGPVASSTPNVDRTGPSQSGGSHATDNSKKAPVLSIAKAHARQSISSPSSDMKSSSGRSTPANSLKEQLASQSEQLASQAEQLASQTEKLNSQSEKLNAQEEKLVSQSELLTLQESRISELTMQDEKKKRDVESCRCQLREAVYSFDIMAIVCQNFVSRESEARELIGTMSSEFETVCSSLDESTIELNAVTAQKDALEEELSLASSHYQRELDDLTVHYRNAIKAEKSKWQEEKEKAVQKVIEQHSAEVKTLKRYHNKEMDHVDSHSDMRMKELKADYEKRLYRNKKIHENELNELQKQHEKKVAEITQRFEEMKVALTERVQSLSAEGSDLKNRATHHEEIMRRNSDYKIQVAIQQFQHLPEENASLKAVLDLRINENADLRRQNTELQGKLGELEEAREKQSQLLRQIENLEAIISLKTENEKQLHDKHQQLLRRYERESKEKKRLSMGYEELLYKLEERQSTDDLTKSSLSDIPSMTSSAVIMRPRADSSSRPRHRGLQHDRSKRRTIASSREFDS